MRVKDTAGRQPNRSGAVSMLIGSDLRRGDVDSTNNRSTARIPTMPGTRTSTTATRTTTTRARGFAGLQSADQYEIEDQDHADFSFEDLVVAYDDCRRTKRNTASALKFEERVERNLRELYDALQDGSYRPGPSICFAIHRPKHREVIAADFRDRIVHHLLYNQIGPRFERGFIADTCACIPGRGTLYAARRLEAKIRSITQNWQRPARYLKCDISNFFVSINKPKLRDLIAKRVHEPFWMSLAEIILFHDVRQNVVIHGQPEQMAMVPAYKRLLLQPPHLGLPIGNLSSQIFANIYLDPLDQYSKHQLDIKHYIRYVDDILLLHESAEWLNRAHDRIEAFLERELGLHLNPKKTIRQPIPRGVDFVGQVVKPWRRYIRRRTYNDVMARTATIADAEFFETVQSYFGLLGQASASHYDRARLAQIVLRRQHIVNGQFTKTYRRPA